MAFDSQKHHRRSIRSPGYDYRAAGGYFVTICATQKRCIFGKIENGVVRLHTYGRIVEKCWRALPEHFAHVVLDEFVVMPNHFHGIVILTASGRGLACQAPTTPAFSQPLAGSLGTIINSLKSAVTRTVNIHRTERDLSPVHVWQRNYFERIIRDEKELNDTRRYILENPLHWETDENYPV